MIVTCPECAARYKLDRSRVSSRGARITCPRCKHVFVVYPRDEEPGEATLTPSGFQRARSTQSVPRPTAKPKVAEQAPAASAASKPQRDASALDFKKVGIGSWKVRVKIGLVYDFSDIKTLRKYISDGRVTAEDVISHDGSTWVPIGDIPDLDAYFIEVYERAELRAAAPPPIPDSFDEDQPTSIMKMGGDSNLAAAALAAAAQEAQQEPVAAPTPAPQPRRPAPAASKPFVDPFAQLKEDKRRRPRPAAAKGAPPVDSKRSPLPFIAGGLVLVVIGLGAWYFLGATPEPPPPVTPEPANTEQMDEARDHAQDELDKLDEQLKAELEAAKIREAEEAEREKLVPVGPSGPGPGLRPVVPDKLPTQSTPETLSADHAGQCQTQANRGSWSQAVGSCSQAVKADARDTKSAVSYGIALYETGKADQARAQLEKARASGSRDPRIEKYLGHIARKQGDIFGANAHYQAYLATSPRDAAAIQALMQGG